jgi:hypothetical protein
VVVRARRDLDVNDLPRTENLIAIQKIVSKVKANHFCIVFIQRMVMLSLIDVDVVLSYLSACRTVQYSTV